PAGRPTRPLRNGVEPSLRAQRSNPGPVVLSRSRLLRRSAPRNDRSTFLPSSPPAFGRPARDETARSCHCERSEAISGGGAESDRDCFVAPLLAMTGRRFCLACAEIRPSVGAVIKVRPG